MEVSLSKGRSGEGEDVNLGSGPVDTQETQEERGIPEEDMQRANLYGLLARLLAEPMSDETLEVVRSLESENDDSELGKALGAFGALATRTARNAALEEFSTLFYGDGSGGELLPYASHYLTGFLLEKPLANLRGDMMELGIQTSGISKEPEDHIAFLCEIMHGLITGTFGAPVDLPTQKAFFAKHIAPWVGLFFEELESAESAALYMPVGTIGKLFMAIEAEAFELAA